MAKGRKRKPTAQRKAEGNPGKRPLSDAEPRFGKATVVCPKWLSAEAKREWNRLAPQVLALGVVTDADVATFAAYCQTWADYVKACQEVGKHGAVVKEHRKDGWVSKRSPWAITRGQCQALLVKYAAELGLTPTSRSKVTTAHPPAEGEDDILDAPVFRVIKGGKT